MFGNKYEVYEYVGNLEPEVLRACLETLESKKVLIGEGDNAEIFSVNSGVYKNLCLKKMKKIPRVLGNHIDTEVDFQRDSRELGVRTPRTLARLIDTEKKEQYIIMERIEGCSIKDLFTKGAALPEKYNHAYFWEKMKKYVAILHEGNIHHRDLHWGNVMIEESGEPVILDFGTATRSFGEDNPYKESAKIMNDKTGRYEEVRGYYTKDIGKIQALEEKMRIYS